MRAAMRALLPDFSRLSLKSSTGMMAEPAAPAAPAAPEPAALNEWQILWRGLSQEEQILVLNILHLRYELKFMSWNQRGDKDANFKQQRAMLEQLPEWLSNRMKVTAANREAMKKEGILPIEWDQALIDRPEYHYLFESPEMPQTTGVDSDDDDEENPRDPDPDPERFLDADERMMSKFQPMLDQHFGRRGQ